MNKVAHYLQEHLQGEVVDTPTIRKQFSTDASVFSVIPSVVVYPRGEADVRKTARFSWQLAERGKIIPITARGAGTDYSGAAIGSGIVMVFPAHMNRILELDSKTGDVVVEPGITYGKLQQTLHTHGRFLPPYPASLEYSTVGGAVANNASGEKSVKYGDTRKFVKSLRVVLANGELIETRRLSKRELSKKLGLNNFEGEVYRALDTLIEENKKLLQESNLAVTRNAAGYALSQVKRKDGSFDLTPLFVGSQGTLGVVTEITLSTAPYHPETTLIGAFFDDAKIAEQVMQDIAKLPESPSAVEIIDDKLLAFVDGHNPNQLKKILQEPFPRVTMLIEFDNANQRIQKKMIKRVTKLLDKAQVSYQVEEDENEKSKLWKIRHTSAAVLAHVEGAARALPIIEDAIVPLDKIQQVMSGLYDLFGKMELQPAIWGHGMDGQLSIQPFLDLSQVGDRQKALRLMDDYYAMVIDHGGSTSGSHGDGRLRGPYLERLTGKVIYDLFEKTKIIFDPHGMLNPGVKVDVTTEDVKPLLRHEYSLDYLAQHLPRS